MRFRLAPKLMTLNDLELLFLSFGEFPGIWQIVARWRWRLLQSTTILLHFSWKCQLYSFTATAAKAYRTS